MPCEKCYKFPAPTSNFKMISKNVERHGVLYRCKNCEDFVEVVAESRRVNYFTLDEARRYYDVP